MGDDPVWAETALLIIDMINPLSFEGADRIIDDVDAAADVILRLRSRADAAGAPVVYVNDNFGCWSDDRREIIARAANSPGHGGRTSQRMKPRDRDIFIIKPQHSGFYGTSLPVVLPNVGARRLVLTGLAAEFCVLFTAADAFMRDYQVRVPANAVAAARPERLDWALDVMQALGADTRRA